MRPLRARQPNRSFVYAVRTLSVFLLYSVVRTADMQDGPHERLSVHNATSNHPHPPAEEFQSPTKIRHLEYRSFRFSSLSSFAAAARSSNFLSEVTRRLAPSLAVNSSTHRSRSRYHRNTPQCSPLLCPVQDDDDDTGDGGRDCPVERNRRLKMADESARQCVHVVSDRRIEQVIVAAIETDNLYETFCASRHLYCRPQPEIIPVNKLCKMTLHYQYYPDYAVLHRCPSALPCCEDMMCAPVPGSVKNVSFSFYVLKTSGAASEGQVHWDSVETFTFENHTACNCVQIQTQLKDEPQVEAGNSIKSNNNPRNSIASNQLAPKESRKRKRVCTRCPKPFICKEQLKINRCKCQCKSNDSICKEIMKGTRPLNKTQQKCIRLERCFPPKCAKTLIYSRRNGKCIAQNIDLDPELDKLQKEDHENMEQELEDGRTDKIQIEESENFEHKLELEDMHLHRLIAEENAEHSQPDEREQNKIEMDELSGDYFGGKYSNKST